VQTIGGTAGAVLELELVAIPFVEEMICARAATIGEEMAVKSRDGVEALSTGGASHRSQRDPRDRLGL
jgi:hydrogenase/urease accessory protein HupE